MDERIPNNMVRNRGVSFKPDIEKILMQATKNNVTINKLLESYGYNQRVKTVFMQQQQPERGMER